MSVFAYAPCSLVSNKGFTMTNHVIRIPLTGQPSHRFTFAADADGNGYHAEITAQRESGKCLHHLSVRQGQPLGAIFWTLDLCNVGAWASAEVPGFGITEKDLYCAALWAIQGINHRHAISKCENKR